MGAWISYTAVAGLILLSLYIIYKWLLTDENQPRFNRYVLLGCFAAATLLPLINIDLWIDEVPSMAEAGLLTPAGPASIDIETEESRTSVIPYILIGIYLAGVVAAAAYMIMARARLSRIVGRCEVKDMDQCRLALCNDTKMAPFSWKRTIVINRKDYESAGDIIMTHELAHIAHNHRLDLRLMHIYGIVMWYNPAVWLMIDELKTVHEYQADRTVLESGVDARSYQMLLIKKAVGQSFPILANSLNHSNLKKRITMMLRNKSKRSRRARALALVPAVALALLAVNTPLISNALETMSETDLAIASGDKVTQNPATNNDKPVIYLNGEVYNGPMESINHEDIKDITVSKDGTPKIFINTFKEGEARPERSNVSVDDVVVVGAGSQKKDVAPAVQQMPEFPGGQTELMKFIMENIKYPEEMKDIKGKLMVVVRFTIDTDGSVVNPTVVKSAGEAFDNEALRVINKLPKFTPGKTDGKPVASNYTLPITFAAR